ncbi:hypothetical protein BGX24_000556 [Mortierella sp. AD032]|nr:hypothetical protein BGX24_000556 [Mortierella sp. AD032]
MELRLHEYVEQEHSAVYQSYTSHGNNYIDHGSNNGNSHIYLNNNTTPTINSQEELALKGDYPLYIDSLAEEIGYKGEYPPYVEDSLNPSSSSLLGVDLLPFPSLTDL